MIFDTTPVAERGEVRFRAMSDDARTLYGTLFGTYSADKREVTVVKFVVEEGYTGQRIEVALFSALRVLAERQLHHGVTLTLGPDVPEDVAKAIADLLKKAKFMH